MTDYDALAERLAEAERERDEWHARAIALFWKGDADGATCGHVRAATATIKQLLAADSATASQPSEIALLRDAQTRAVMPLIGPLLDAWDGMANDEKSALEEAEPAFSEAMEAVGKAMTSDKSSD